MKKWFTILFIFFYLQSFSTNYYVAAAGNDANSGLIGFPWLTTTKVNAHTFSAGDSCLFNRGDVFPGFLIPNGSGTSTTPIVYGAYGTGSNPVITGLTTVSAWTNLGSNIWESTSTVSAAAMCNVVLINGINMPMGRYPNTGYLQYQTFSTNTTITSSSLTGTPNWTGAEAVIKKQRWIEDRNPITGQTSGTLTYTTGTGLPYVNGQSYNGQANFGFFIQNDIRTLDTIGEWYYNPTTFKLDIYNTVSPTNVQISTVDTIVYIVGKKYLTYDHINFTGANFDIFYLGADSNITIQYCNLSYAYNGILGQNFSSHPINFKLLNSTINQCNNNALNISSEFTTASILNDTIKNTGMIPGAGGSGDGQYEGANAQGIGSKVENCEVDTTGYIPIGFKGTGIVIKNNFIRTFCIVKDDGGAIYCQPTTDNTDTISFNVAINGVGCNAGTNGTGLSSAYGIYCDNAASNLIILNNSVANMSFAGYYFHDSHGIVLRNNTAYNCQKASLLIKNDDTPDTIRNLIVKNNIFFEQDTSQVNSPQNLCLNASTLHNDIAKFGTFDSNYYARPIADSLVFDAEPDGATHNLYNLSGWQTYSGFDLNSKHSPAKATDTIQLLFVYNPSISNQSTPLYFNYIEATGLNHNALITLIPFSSAALIENGPPYGSLLIFKSN